MDLRKYKAWSPSSGEPANVEYKTVLGRKLMPWRATMTIGVAIGLLAAGCYAVIIHPMNHADEWRAVQAENRKGINQDDIQPGGMRVWSDPFHRKKS